MITSRANLANSNSGNCAFSFWLLCESCILVCYGGGWGARQCSRHTCYRSGATNPVPQQGPRYKHMFAICYAVPPARLSPMISLMLVTGIHRYSIVITLERGIF